MTDKEYARGLLRHAIGRQAADFRDSQREAIDALVNRRERRLVVERTGWGKSMVYFIATKLLRSKGSGGTLIVLPLLALMRNQVKAAERLVIEAITINSTNQRQWDEAKETLLR